MKTELQQAVIEQLGYENYFIDSECQSTMEDIANHGIDGGFSGFIYYSDTVEFFENNRDLIIKELLNLSEELGISATEMVQGFRCLNGDYDTEVARVLCDLHGMIANLLTGKLHHISELLEGGFYISI